MRARGTLGYAVATTLAGAVLALLAGCSGSGDASPEPGDGPTGRTSSAPTDPSSSSTMAGGGPAALDWKPVPGPVRNDVTTGGGWTLTVTGNGSGWRLAGHGSESHGSVAGFRVSDALLDRQWAVVVLQDRTEQQPSRARVIELASGRTFTLDGRSDVPTTNGGTWALGDDRLLHATVHAGAYCVASVDLASRSSTLGWCAPKRHGFNGARITPAGASVLGFDSGRPSCRTLMALDGTDGTPFPGVPDCQAWDGLRTADGAVWSVIPNEHRIEDGHFYARSGDRESDLGPGTAGSLVWCGGAAWFARDPARDGAPATLMRWAPEDGLSVAYRSPAGRAFLSAPRCGGNAITVTALAEKGDEQVTARLG